ncbi:MAG: family 43 glycosylhydrolase [Chloroflexi bacterium]|nr:family 43 glycosylhydrolase [Chloroflexota bacterium]
MSADATYTNPVSNISDGNRPIHLGDPFVMRHEGIYYLYGTTDELEGFRYYTSRDLVHWEQHGWVWRKSPYSWAESRFWAPEVKFYRGRFYLTYSGKLRASKPARMLMGIAVADSPTGPFHDYRAPWFDLGYNTIDSHLLIDDDMTPYLYFSQNGHQDGYDFGRIFGARLTNDLAKLDGEPKLLLNASQPWEHANWQYNRTNEGPFVIKHGGVYYMMYSGNSTFEAHYGIGYATARRPLNKWTKNRANPIATSNPELGVSSPGHNSVVESPDGSELFCVYHTHADPTRMGGDRVVNIDRLTIDGQGRLRMQGPTRMPQPMPSGAPVSE